MHVEKRKSWRPAVKNNMRMIEAAAGVRCVSCFFLASPATLNFFDNPESLIFTTYKLSTVIFNFFKEERAVRINAVAIELMN